jgi:manganese/zinc/iron transport system permease protein
MNWTSFDTWIVVVGALAAAAAALPGCFLVLRRMSMMGDAISHAVLPGLAVAFLLTGTRASFTMFIGAAIVGVLTALFTQWIGKLGKVDRGAAMGIVFTTSFAIGLLLIVRAADHVDLDPGCVLYGALELTPLDTFAFAGLDIPRAAAVLGAVLLFNAVVIGLLFKEFRLSSFDPALATTLGINASFMHYLLVTMVAITTVAAFEAVGSIIVIAMLIVPPATALLLTNRLLVMLVLSAFIAMASALLGHYSSQALPPLIGFESTTTSGMIAVAAGFFFFLAWIFAPREGLLARFLHRTRALEMPAEIQEAQEIEASR